MLTTELPASTGRRFKSIRLLALLLVAAFAVALTASSQARAADCATAKDCLNAAAWQGAIADDYQAKGDWFAGVARQNFIDAKTWGDKAIFAFHAGDATAATWYKAIADDYAAKAVANSKAADDYHAQAAFYRAAAQNNANRGQFIAALWDADPATPEGIDMPFAVPSDPKKYGCTGTAKILPNRRKIESSWAHTDLFWYRAETPFTFCHGKVTKMWPGELSQSTTKAGDSAGWKYVSRKKVRANCYGGTPERCAWTYQWHFWLDLPTVKIGPVTIDPDKHKYPCVTTQVRGDGAHYRHGGCDLKAWSGPSWGGKE